ncbi:hypothetical protein BDA96_02G366400 [Sorghum bicolor]|uniref:Uncharacterized protein n=1 Tax=Sorghum bicolor TaxID=4558 RepID=A0A921RTK8_SORBI|nr:hypothetical protein BDA96_02G366400 [Sorghum bicolor]
MAHRRMYHHHGHTSAAAADSIHTHARRHLTQRQTHAHDTELNSRQTNHAYQAGRKPRTHPAPAGSSRRGSRRRRRRGRPRRGARQRRRRRPARGRGPRRPRLTPRGRRPWRRRRRTSS